MALTLREVAGLATPEIARAFLVPSRRSPSGSCGPSDGCGRRGSRSACRRPPASRPTARRVARLYLVFNEGYAATRGDELVRRELCAEAIRLAKLLCVLMPDEPEAFGLLALLLLQDSRREARGGATATRTLADQDRSLWVRGRSRRRPFDAPSDPRRPASYQLQAAIAAGHAEGTDPGVIAVLYGALEQFEPSPSSGSTARSRWRSRGTSRAAWRSSTRWRASTGTTTAPPLGPILLRRLGRAEEAAAAYRDALALTENAAERRFLARRLEEVTASTSW